MIKYLLSVMLIASNLLSINNTSINKKNLAGNAATFTYQSLCSDEKPGMINNSNIDYHRSTVIDNLPGNNNYIYNSIGYNGDVYSNTNKSRSYYYDANNGTTFNAVITCYKANCEYNYNSTGFGSLAGGNVGGAYSSTLETTEGLEVNVKKGFNIKNVVDISLELSASFDETESIGSGLSFLYTNESSLYQTLFADFKVAKYLVAIYIPNYYAPSWWDYNILGKRPKLKGYELYYYYTYCVYNTTFKLVQ